MISQKQHSGNRIEGTAGREFERVHRSLQQARTRLREYMSGHRVVGGRCTSAAIRALRSALARHQPVVKECVFKRLLDHESCGELATEFDLRPNEVRVILGRVRRWVHRFTSYFDDDRYWSDRVQPA